MLPPQIWRRRIAAVVGNGRAYLFPHPLRLNPLVLRIRVPPHFNNTSRLLKGNGTRYSRCGKHPISCRISYETPTESPLYPGSASTCPPVGPLLRHASATSVPPHVSTASLIPAMPRPKVKPQDRQRSARACDACKASKKRCDANQPCRLCLKKGTQDTCTFTPTARDRSSRHSEFRSSKANSIAVATDDSLADFGSVPSIPSQRPRAQFGDRPLAAEDAEVDDVVDDADSDTDYVPDSRNSVERTNEQQPLMLCSSSGDKGIKQSLYLSAFHYPAYDKLALPCKSQVDLHGKISIRRQHSGTLILTVFTKDTETLCWTIWFHRPPT